MQQQKIELLKTTNKKLEDEQKLLKSSLTSAHAKMGEMETRIDSATTNVSLLQERADEIDEDQKLVAQRVSQTEDVLLQNIKALKDANTQLKQNIANEQQLKEKATTIHDELQRKNVSMNERLEAAQNQINSMHQCSVTSGQGNLQDSNSKILELQLEISKKRTLTLS